MTDGIPEYKDTVHGLDEFSKLPWDRLDAEWFQRHGGIGTNCRGMPVLSIYDQDGSIHQWEVPQQLVRLCMSYERNGADNVRQEFRDLLQVPRRG